MKVNLMTPKEGYVIVKSQAHTSKTESGFATVENDDDFISYGEVVKGPKSLVGKQVIYHELDAQTFFAVDEVSTPESFAFVKETTILGFYGGE